MHIRRIMAVLFFVWAVSPGHEATAETGDDTFRKRMALFQKMETVTQIPWYDFAAIDQYERNLRNARNDLPDADDKLIAISFPQRQWVGAVNPRYKDTDPLTISLFGGIGLDGNDDGRADSKDPEDVLYALANDLHSYGLDKKDMKIALWNRYERPAAVEIIMEYANIYRTFGKLQLDDNAFPLPLKANYTINNTWGDRRSFGGVRIHEGVDIFADYGVPVKSTTYGYVEVIGWNRYGGWRIGIRSLNNVYHYYAHLKGYAKGIREGDIVQPGELIGYVGSSGYGPEGTQGKFPPHLHYGMYRDNGYIEHSFNPYTYLKTWERRAKE